MSLRSPLATLLPNGPDPRPAFRAVEGLGLVAAAAIPLFIVWTQLFGRFPSPVQYGTALALGLIAIFCLKPAFTGPDGRRTALDLLVSLILIAGALGAWGYYTAEYDAIAASREGLPNRADLWCYGIGTAVVVIGAHRAEGWLLTAVVALAAIYLLFGHLMPGLLEHRPFRLNRVLEIAYGYRGIFGVALGSVVDIVLVFVILGVALRLTGAGEFFNDIALAALGRRRGGAAKISILASTLFGTISGVVVSNIVATGVVTIRLMIRSGYRPRMAAAVEAVASTGGQIAPPVMGAVAFLMADFLGVSYAQVAIAAIIPAALNELAWPSHRGPYPART